MDKKTMLELAVTEELLKLAAKAHARKVLRELCEPMTAQLLVSRTVEALASERALSDDVRGRLSRVVGPVVRGIFTAHCRGLTAYTRLPRV